MSLGYHSLDEIDGILPNHGGFVAVEAVSDYGSLVSGQFSAPISPYTWKISKEEEWNDINPYSNRRSRGCNACCSG